MPNMIHSRNIHQTFLLKVLSAVAVEMNPFVGIPELQENIVYAGRLDFIDRKFLKEVLNSE